MRNSLKAITVVLTLLLPVLKATTITPSLSDFPQPVPDYSNLVIPRVPVYSPGTFSVLGVPTPIIGNTTIITTPTFTPIPTPTQTTQPTQVSNPTPTLTTVPTSAPTPTPAPVDNQTAGVTTQLLQNVTPTGINLQSIPSMPSMPTFLAIPGMTYPMMTALQPPQLNLAGPQANLVNSVIAAGTTTLTQPFSNPLQPQDAFATAPEPGSWMLLLAGATVLMLLYRRRVLAPVKTR